MPEAEGGLIGCRRLLYSSYEGASAGTSASYLILLLFAPFGSHLWQTLPLLHREGVITFRSLCFSVRRTGSFDPFCDLGHRRVGRVSNAIADRRYETASDGISHSNDTISNRGVSHRVETPKFIDFSGFNRKCH